MMGRGSRRSAANRMETGMQYMARGMDDSVEITIESRVSFALAFGISPVQQANAELVYNAFTPQYYQWGSREASELQPIVSLPYITHLS